MVTAVILLNAARARLPEVAQGLADLPEVSVVYSVTGRWDLVAMVHAKTNEELADFVTTRLLKAPGIEKSETLVAFRAYSRHDLEAAFSIGAS